MTRILVGFFFAQLVFVCNAYALSLVVDSNGILTGATGVSVQGVSYDLKFMEGTCATVFGLCDGAYLDLATQSSALAAASALIDQVLVNDPTLGYAFDTNPALTRGCVFEPNCWFQIPYGVVGSNLLIAQAMNQSGNDPDIYQVFNSPFPTSYDSSQDINGTFARFTRVPKPSTFTLMVMGMVLLAGVAVRFRMLLR
jgi:hypothetical protein